MNDKRKSNKERPIFDSLRKPTAPPTRKIGTEREEEKIHPSNRKVKHRKRAEPED